MRRTVRRVAPLVPPPTERPTPTTDLAHFTSSELKSSYTRVRAAALRAPVGIAHNGSSDLVLMPRKSFDAPVRLVSPRHRYADELPASTVASLREPLDDEDARTASGEGR